MSKSNHQVDDIKTTPVDYDPFSGSSVEKLAPSTEAQKEIWLSVQMGDEANCAYNESLSITLTGAFNREAIEQTYIQFVTAIVTMLFGQHSFLMAVHFASAVQ